MFLCEVTLVCFSGKGLQLGFFFKLMSYCHMARHNISGSKRTAREQTDNVHLRFGIKKDRQRANGQCPFAFRDQKGPPESKRTMSICVAGSKRTAREQTDNVHLRFGIKNRQRANGQCPFAFRDQKGPPESKRTMSICVSGSKRTAREQTDNVHLRFGIKKDRQRANGQCPFAFRDKKGPPESKRTMSICVSGSKRTAREQTDNVHFGIKKDRQRANGQCPFAFRDQKGPPESKRTMSICVSGSKHNIKTAGAYQNFVGQTSPGSIVHPFARAQIQPRVCGYLTLLPICLVPLIAILR